MNQTLNNFSYVVDPYSLEPPVECYKLKVVGAVCVAICIFGVFFNSLLLFMCYKYGKFCNSFYTSMIALTVLNLLGLISEMPFIILSNFRCR